MPNTLNIMVSILRYIGYFGGLFVLSYTGIWLRKSTKHYMDHISFKRFLVSKHLPVSTNLTNKITKTNRRLFGFLVFYSVCFVSIFWYFKNEQQLIDDAISWLVVPILFGFFGYYLIPHIPVISEVVEIIDDLSDIEKLSDQKVEEELLDKYLNLNSKDKLQYKKRLLEFGPRLVDAIIDRFIKVVSPYKKRTPKRENIETIDTSDVITVGNPFFLELDKIRSNFYREKNLLTELLTELIKQSEEAKYLVAWRLAKSFNGKLSRGWAIALILYEITEHGNRSLSPNPDVFIGKKYIRYMTKIDNKDERNTWQLLHELTLAITNYTDSPDPSSIDHAKFMWKREMGIWIMIKSTGYFLLSL